MSLEFGHECFGLLRHHSCRSLGLDHARAGRVPWTPFSGAVSAQISRPFVPSGSLELAPGITYTQGTMRTSGKLPQSVRVATIDPRVPTVRIRSLLSNDAVPLVSVPVSWHSASPPRT